MTSKKLKDFRHQLLRVLRENLPDTEPVVVGKLANRLENLMIVQAFKLTEIEHAIDCPCWDCIGKVTIDVMRHQCEMKVTRQMAEEHD